MIETQSAARAITTTGKTTELSVEGMTCGNCARHVTEAIQSIPGVRNAVVSLEANHASVRWNSGAEDVPAVIEALRGHPLFAHVTLTRSERSPIAALVTEMLEGLPL